VQQTGVATLPCTGKTETQPTSNGFKNQPFSVQQIATPEVRNSAFYGCFERFA
jgi:hypothetical protein